MCSIFQARYLMLCYIIQMTKEVFCIKYHLNLPAMESAPFPNEKGEYILENVSHQAWAEWLKHQTMLINEKHLSMVNKEDRDYLTEQMDKFLNNKDFDKPAGYVPPAEDK